MRLIDADKIKKPIYAEEDNVTGFGMNYDEMCGYNDGIDAVFNAIRHAPTIDAVPVVHGPWNYKCQIDGQSYRYCSECLEIIYGWNIKHD